MDERPNETWSAPPERFPTQEAATLGRQAVAGGRRLGRTLADRERLTAGHPNHAATASLVLGLLTVVFGLLAAVPAVVCGAIGMTRRNRRGRAVAGLVLGIVLGAINLALFLVVWAVLGNISAAVQWLLGAARLALWGYRLYRWQEGEDVTVTP